MPYPTRRSVRRRRRLLPLLAVCILPAVSLFAGDAADLSKDGKSTKPVPQLLVDDTTPLDTLETEVSYVGFSTIKQKEFRAPSPLAPGGVQSTYRHIEEVESSIEYGHRFHLFDKVYLKLGFSYERFDFSETDAPLPSTLSSIAGVVNVEYIVKGNVGAFLDFKPGVFYGNSQISLGSFDVPIAAGALFPVPYFKNVYGLAGARFSLLSKYPVLPIAGLVILFNDHLRIQAVPPEPRIIYTVNKKLDFFVGGELLGEAYKRNSDDDARPQFRRFNKGIIDYSEERVGAGLTFTPIKQVDIDLAGGWDLHRSFDYYRDDSKRFETHGSPYAKLSVSAEF